MVEVILNVVLRNGADMISASEIGNNQHEIKILFLSFSDKIIINNNKGP